MISDTAIMHLGTVDWGMGGAEARLLGLSCTMLLLRFAVHEARRRGSARPGRRTQWLSVVPKKISSPHRAVQGDASGACQRISWKPAASPGAR